MPEHTYGRSLASSPMERLRDAYSKISAAREPTVMGVDLADGDDRTAVTYVMPTRPAWIRGDGHKALCSHLKRTTSTKTMAICMLHMALGHRSLAYLPFPVQIREDG